MATFIALIDFTEAGIRAIGDTTRRSEAFVASVERQGARVKDVYWTLGAHDGVLIFEAPDDEAAAAALLELGSRGMARTHTLRAFDRVEMEAILARGEP